MQNAQVVWHEPSRRHGTDHYSCRTGNRNNVLVSQRLGHVSMSNFMQLSGPFLVVCVYSSSSSIINMQYSIITCVIGLLDALDIINPLTG